MDSEPCLTQPTISILSLCNLANPLVTKLFRYWPPVSLPLGSWLEPDYSVLLSGNNYFAVWVHLYPVCFILEWKTWQFQIPLSSLGIWLWALLTNPMAFSFYITWKSLTAFMKAWFRLAWTRTECIQTRRIISTGI